MDNQPAAPVQPLSPADPSGAAYLDQIAAKPKTKGGLFSGKMLVLLGALLAVVVVAIAAIAFSGGGKTPKTNSETLYLRITNLQKTAAKFHKSLKNNSLRATNTTFQTQLTSILQELGTQLPKDGIKPDKIEKKLKTDEQARIDKINDTLEDARLNVRLDRSYAIEMSYQIELVISLMQKIERTAKKDYKSLLENTIPKLESMGGQFSKFADD